MHLYRTPEYGVEMMGALFLLFNLAILLFVGLEEFNLNLGFIDYYSFRDQYFEHRFTFMWLWGYHLIVFFVFSWVFKRFLFASKRYKYLRGWKSSQHKYFSNNKISYGAIFVVINLLFLHLQYGRFLYFRDTYQPDIEFNLFYVAYILTLFISMVYLLFCKSRIKYFLMLIVILFSFAIATRITGVILVFLSVLLLNRNEYLSSFFLFISGLFSILIALYLRSMESQGAVNYILNFAITDMGEFILPIISYTVNFNFYLSMATYFDFLEKGVYLQDFFVSLNPLPGVLAGWYDGVNLKHAVLPVVPYSSWGEVLALGLFGSSAFFIFLSLIIAYFDSIIQKEKFFLSVLVTICGMLFIVYFSQYQLRSAFRYIYYAFFIIVFIQVKRNLLRTKIWKS